jgi:hypothetical protein
MGPQAYRLYGCVLQSHRPLTGLAAAAPGAVADVRVSWSAEEAPEASGLTAECPVRVEGGTVAFRVEGVATFLVQDGRAIQVRPEPGSDPAEVQVFLLGSALGALLYQRGVLPLHGSAVETPRGAMVFVGPSGIGKSTLAGHFRRAGFRLLSDDVCAVARDAGGAPVVLPAFPHLRLKADAAVRLLGEAAPTRDDVDKRVLPLGTGFAGEPVPLAAVHRLEDGAGPGPQLLPLRGFEAMKALADNLYRPFFLEGMATRGEVLRLAGEIAASAEVHVLRRPRDASRLDALVAWLDHGWSGPAGPARP